MGSGWLPFGTLGRPHGTKGEILLCPFNREGAGIAASALPLPVQVAKAEECAAADIVAVRPVRGGFLVRFAGAESREAVAAMVGRQLRLPRSLFGPLGEAEFYVEDLPGSEVFLPDGQRLGRVARPSGMGLTT